MKGKLTISRIVSNKNPDYIRIEIIDDASNVRFVEVAVDLATFAAAVTGLSHLDVDFEVVGLDKVGKQRQTKNILIPTPDRLYGDALWDFLINAAKYQIGNGWVLSSTQAELHTRDKDGNVSLRFVRWV